MNTGNSEETRVSGIYDDPAITEAKEVARTVEIHLADKRMFRLEIVRSGKRNDYGVLYYQRKTLYVWADGSINSQAEQLDPPRLDPLRFDVWVLDRRQPEVWGQDLPEAALSQALNFLTGKW